MDNLMENKPPITTPDTTATGLGTFLRSEREGRHITIEQVASATKISIKLLHALEQDNFDELPAKPFVRGFITSYARFLGIEAQEVLSRYDSFLDQKAERKQSKRPNKAPHIFVESYVQKDKSKTILASILIGFLFLAVGVYVVIKPTLKRHKRGVVEKKAVSNEELYTVVAPGTTLPPVTSELEFEKPDMKDSLTDTKTATPPAVAKVETKVEVKKATPEISKEVPKPVVKVEPPKPAEVKKVEPPKPVVATTAPTSTSGQPAVNSKWPEVPYSEVKQLLVVRAQEDSYIRYQADDFSLRQYMLRKGQKIFIRARQNIRFRAYKENAVEISYDSINFKPFQSGQTLILPQSAADQFREKPFIGLEE